MATKSLYCSWGVVGPGKDIGSDEGKEVKKNRKGGKPKFALCEPPGFCLDITRISMIGVLSNVRVRDRGENVFYYSLQRQAFA